MASITELLGQPKKPTVSGLLQKPLDTSGDPSAYSGQVADWYFSDSFSGTVLSNFGQGVKEGWGAAQDWSRETDKFLRETGVYNDYTTGRSNLIKGLNEVFLRPVIHGLSGAALGALGGLTGGISGVAEGLRSQSKKLGSRGALMGAASELVGGALEGAFGGFGEVLLPYSGGLSRLTSSYRAKAIIGEGETGYFNTREPSQINLEARAKAAQDSGTPVKAPEKPDFDVNSLVRKIDPETFAEIDRLKSLQENLRLSRDYLKSKITGDYKADLKISKQLDDIPGRLAEIDLKLRDMIPKEVRAKETFESWMRTEGKEGEAFRKWVQAEMLEHEMLRQEISKEVASASFHADLLLPDPKTRLELEKKYKPKEVIPEAPVTKTETPVQKGQNEAVTVVEGETNRVVPSVAETPQTGTLLKEVEGTGPLRIRGTSKSLEAEAVEAGLTKYFTEDELQTYNQASNKDQWQRFLNFAEADYQRARRVAMGEEAPPEGLLRGTVFKGIKDIAIRDRDLETLRDLSRSRTAQSFTTMGQEIQSLAMRDKLDPVEIIKAVEESRAKIKETKEFKTQKEAIIREAEQAMELFKSDVAVFIRSLECE